MECDFLAIYRQDMYDLDGPQFLKLASRVPYYKGAVRAKAEIEAQEPGTDQTYSEPDERGFKPGQAMTMSEAISKPEKSHEFDALNEESRRNGMGDLFEIEQAPTR